VGWIEITVYSLVDPLWRGVRSGWCTPVDLRAFVFALLPEVYASVTVISFASCACYEGSNSGPTPGGVDCQA